MYVNDVFKKTVSLYRSSTAYKQNVYSTGTLPYGLHKVKISWYPKNISGRYITLDAVDIVGKINYGSPAISSMSPPCGSSRRRYHGRHHRPGFRVSLWSGGRHLRRHSPASSYTVNSPTKITAMAPAHEAAAVRVQVTTSGGSSTDTAVDDFTYADPVTPTIASLAPASGTLLGGTTVTLTGTGFIDVSEVSFGGVKATGVTVKSLTQLTAVTPAHALPETVGVKVTAAGGTSEDSGADDYSYIVPVNAYQQSDSRLAFSGTWSTISTASASGGSYRRSLTSGAYVVIPFQGSGLTLFATRSTSQGKADLYVDNLYHSTIDLYRSSTAYRQNAWSVSRASLRISHREAP